MKEIKVKASREYNVFIASGSSGFVNLLDTYKIKRVFVITDENVYGLYSNLFANITDRMIGFKVIKPGEESKNIEVVTEIYSELLRAEANRKAAIISLGGGVVGDIAGFTAATFMRGVNLIQVPTTLIAQCDSSIGGKNGFNLGKIKNIVGTFYQPLFVYTDVNFLKTLNDREYMSGIAEIIKYGYVCDSGLFNYLQENKKGIHEREIDKLLHIVGESAKIKSRIVEKDEFDSDSRQVLNFGHTIGHAVESMAEFRISHGEAVSIGMNMEAFIAMKLGYIQEHQYNILLDLLKYFHLPHANEEMEWDRVMEYMKNDKKKESNNIKFALPIGIGSAIITEDIKPGTVNSIIKNMAWR